MTDEQRAAYIAAGQIKETVVEKVEMFRCMCTGNRRRDCVCGNTTSAHKDKCNFCGRPGWCER